jgi:hypothetical protein
MTKPIVRDPISRNQPFDADIIELCVRWYITYRLSYRDLVERMAERGVAVATRRSFDGYLATFPNSRDAGTGSPKPWVPRGGGRDVHFDQSEVALSVSSGRQEPQKRRLSAPPRPRHRGRSSSLSQGAAI